MPDICQRIQLLPKLLGITEYQLAKSINRRQGAIQNITVKGSKPGYEILVAIAEAHGLSYEWLMTGRGSHLQNNRHKLVTPQNKPRAK